MLKEQVVDAALRIQGDAVDSAQRALLAARRAHWACAIALGIDAGSDPAEDPAEIDAKETSSDDQEEVAKR